jgi:3'-phosphoadenosine 5'-phosphosulfate sulfotransferase (PAPS reductase)/FAD synthetase
MHNQRTRHILNLSGGKDSTALAIYLRDRVPDLEYLFLDTEKELPETYEYLSRIEAYLGKPIVRLKHDGRGFDHWLKVYRGYLPSSRMRWCTKHLKIHPFERYVGDDDVVSYIGIRADENRSGYISRKPNIHPAYPFKDAGITKRHVYEMLERSGLGLPDYYTWRTRSGCYFCFFQQKIEWVGLLENHPDLYEKAMAYEQVLFDNPTRFMWNGDESLEELRRPERVAEIRAEHERRAAAERSRPKANRTLVDVLMDSDSLCSVLEAYEVDSQCQVCR